MTNKLPKSTRIDVSSTSGTRVNSRAKQTTGLRLPNCGLQPVTALVSAYHGQPTSTATLTVHKTARSTSSVVSSTEQTLFWYRKKITNHETQKKGKGKHLTVSPNIMRNVSLLLSFSFCTTPAIWVYKNSPIHWPALTDLGTVVM